MPPALHPSSIYPEIVSHSTLDIMTKLTEYPFQAMQVAKLEAQRSNAEARVLQMSKTTIV